MCPNKTQGDIKRGKRKNLHVVCRIDPGPSYPSSQLLQLEQNSKPKLLVQNLVQVHPHPASLGTRAANEKYDIKNRKHISLQYNKQDGGQC